MRYLEMPDGLYDEEGRCLFPSASAMIERAEQARLALESAQRKRNRQRLITVLLFSVAPIWLTWEYVNKPL